MYIINMMVSGTSGTLEENTLADKLGIYMENTLMVVIILGYDLSNSIFGKLQNYATKC